jgi:hypothetical protein
VLGQCLTQDPHGWIVGLFDIQSLHGLLKTLTVGFRTYDVLLGTSTVVTWILMMLFRNPLFACRVFFQESNKGSAMRRYDVDLRGVAIHLQWQAEASYKAVYSWLVAALPSQVHDSWQLQVRTDDELFG